MVSARRPLLVMHAPRGTSVPFAGAAAIFPAARHPKSFVSLDKANHLLTDRDDAFYAANVLAAWAGRYVPLEDPHQIEGLAGTVIVSETGEGKFTQAIAAGAHALRAHGPEARGR